MSTHNSEIAKYDYMYAHYPAYGQIDEQEPRFAVAMRLLNSMGDVRTVLDAGTGRGGFYNIIKGRYEAWGIEPSQVAIEKFHRNHPNVLSIKIQDLPHRFKENQFDAVICLDVLEHIPPEELDAALRSMAHVGKNHFIFSIAVHEDRCDGMDLHVSLFDFNVWEERLRRLFHIASKQLIHDGRACIYCLEKRACMSSALRNIPQFEPSKASASKGLPRRDGQAQPFISVLIPTYNHADYLPEALDSLLSQTYDNWEAVVVNDGSTDNTRTVLERYVARDRRFKVFDKENGGTASAMNMAIRKSIGQWVCWLSSDDLFEPDALQIFAAAIGEHPEIMFFHSHFFVLEEETGRKYGTAPERYKNMPHPEHQVIAFFVGNYVHGISIAINKQIFHKSGFFNEALRYAQDVDMWLRISALTPSLFINNRTCVSRVSSASGTMAFPEAGPMEVARLCMNFLNENRFPTLFPWLDLEDTEDVLEALQAVFRVATNASAHMYWGIGYTPALVERMCEWLSFDCKPEIKEAVLKRIEPVITVIAGSSLPQEIKDVFVNIGLLNHLKIAYHPYDPLREMARNVPRLMRQGRNAEADQIVRYLKTQK